MGKKGCITSEQELTLIGLGCPRKLSTRNKGLLLTESVSFGWYSELSWQSISRDPELSTEGWINRALIAGILGKVPYGIAEKVTQQKIISSNPTLHHVAVTVSWLDMMKWNCSLHWDYSRMSKPHNSWTVRTGEKLWEEETDFPVNDSRCDFEQLIYSLTMPHDSHGL